MTGLSPPRYRLLHNARQELLERLRRVVGTDTTDEQAQGVLESAKVWSPTVAPALAAYLAERPDAFTAPAPDSPVALVRLLRVLHDLGHGDLVTLAACAVCGDTDRPLLTRTAEGGLCCQRCRVRLAARPCARCGETRPVMARRPERGICQRCRDKDPDYVKQCAGCGRVRPPRARRADGGVLCQGCAQPPLHACHRYHRRRPAHALTTDGPVCQDCYTPPERRCGVCGEVGPIATRTTDDSPETCLRCHRNLDECVVCGHVRNGSRLRGGAFHCTGCRPRPPRTCAYCAHRRPAKVNWPVGAVCGPCYSQHVRNLRPCAGCDAVRVLVARAEDGTELCGPCVGSDLTYTCRNCGASGDPHSEGRCTRCVATERIHALLDHDDGTLDDQLRPLVNALTSAARPYSVINWLRASPAARLLAELAARRTTITHQILDRLPRDQNTAFVRNAMIATGSLPRRNEPFAQLVLWLDEALTDLPGHHSSVIRPFAEWKIIRDARRRAERDRYTAAAAATDRADVRTGIELMTWLDGNNLTLTTFTQTHLDTWLSDDTARIRRSTSFLRWTIARRLTARLEVPTPKHTLPSRFLDNDDYDRQLRRCLNDDTLPTEVRISAALTRLYALPVARIVELTTDRFHRDDDGAYLTLDRNPVLLPPKLALLIEQQTTRPRHLAMLTKALDQETVFLLPGRQPGQPRAAAALVRLLRRHGFPVIAARNTAMIEAVAELPPTIINDLCGIHPRTAHAWANYAQDSWADYLAAHSLSIADVDGNGTDEIIYGGMTINANGTGRYTTNFYAHGDALHVSDFLPNRPGQEIWQIHEQSSGAAATLRDANSGAVIMQKNNTCSCEGPARGAAGDVHAGNSGAEFWGRGTGLTSLFNGSGGNVGRSPSSANFLAWWDADPVRELLDGNHVDKYGTGGDTRLLTGTGAHSINGTKSTPSLSGDLFGDWREEVILPRDDNAALRIYATTTQTDRRIHTLMHDAQYRVAIAWQNTAYNQPPHPSFFLGNGMSTPPQPNIYVR